MTVRLTDITSEAIQRHRLILADDTITLLLRYYGQAQLWTVDVTFRGAAVRGVKLSVGTLHLLNNNWPFDIIIEDKSGQDIDPYAIDDFSTGRCCFYVLNAKAVQSIRGRPVP